MNPLDPHLDDAPESLLGEMFLFLREEQRLWLAPMLLVLGLCSFIIVLAEGSAVAPFIYAIF